MLERNLYVFKWFPVWISLLAMSMFMSVLRLSLVAEKININRDLKLKWNEFDRMYGEKSALPNTATHAVKLTKSTVLNNLKFLARFENCVPAML